METLAPDETVARVVLSKDREALRGGAPKAFAPASEPSRPFAALSLTHPEPAARRDAARLREPAERRQDVHPVSSARQLDARTRRQRWRRTRT
jgi:hypothetical protein